MCKKCFQLFSPLSENIYFSISLSWISSIQFEMIFRYRYDLTFNFISVIVFENLIFNYHPREWASILISIINVSIVIPCILSEFHILLIIKSPINILIQTLLILQRENLIVFIDDNLFLGDHILLDDELVTDVVRLSVLS